MGHTRECGTGSLFKNRNISERCSKTQDAGKKRNEKNGQRRICSEKLFNFRIGGMKKNVFILWN